MPTTSTTTSSYFGVRRLGSPEPVEGPALCLSRTANVATVQNKPFTLKTGERGIIRSATEADAAALLVYARENLREGTGSVTTLEEFTLSIEDERKFLTEHAEKPGWLALLAEVNGKVVGFTGFRNNARKRLAHNGMLGISVAREFRGRGVGEALLSALLEWARANPLHRESLSRGACRQRATRLRSTANSASRKKAAACAKSSSAKDNTKTTCSWPCG
jgi:RimJ/RimL family protein N-acetyltransferase